MFEFGNIKKEDKVSYSCSSNFKTELPKDKCSHIDIDTPLSKEKLKSLIDKILNGTDK